LKKGWNATKNYVMGDENQKYGKTKKGLRILGTATGILPLYSVGKAGWKGAKDLNIRRQVWWGKTKKSISDTLDKYSLTKKINKWRMNSKSANAARGTIKRDKYERLTEEYSQKVTDLRVQLNATTDKTERTKLQNEIDKAEKQMEINTKKTLEWQKKQTSSQLDLKNFKAKLEAKAGPAKKELKTSIDSNVNKLLGDEGSINNAKAQIDKEIAAENAIQTTTQSELKNIQSQLNTLMSNSDENTQRNELLEKKKQLQAKLTESITKQKTLTAGKTNNDFITKRVLLNNSDSLYGPQQIAKLTRTLGVSSKLAQPGTPENKRLQDRIKAHIDSNGKQPSADDLTKYITEEGFEKTLANKTLEMSSELRNSITSKSDKYTESKSALESIPIPSEKDNIINESIKTYKAKLQTKINSLINEREIKPTPQLKAKKLADLEKTRQILQRINLLESSKKTPKQIYDFISAQDSQFSATITTNVNDFNAKQATFKTAVANPENLKTAADAYYNARTKKMSPEGLKQLAAIYNPFIKTYIERKHKYSIQSEIIKGLDKYKDHIRDLLKTNPLALKAEDPATYDKIIASQSAKPSTPAIIPTEAANPINESEA
jgi:hypothetical protein